MKHHSLLLTIFALFGLAAAQFQFFDNFFGGQQQRQQHQQGGGASQYAAFSENVGCSQYQCPATLDCVAKPSDCPCPNVEDVKCLIPDGDDGDATVICLRGGSDCSQLDKLLKRGASGTKTK